MSVQLVTHEYQTTFTHRTAKFTMQAYCKSNFIPVNEVVTSRKQFYDMCKNGCSNYGTCLSCPPFAPSFDAIKLKYKYLYTFLLYAFTAEITMPRKNPYLVVINADRTLSPFVMKLGRVFERELNGLLLKDAECRLCHPCKILLKQPCAKPSLRRNSLESTGVDVEALVNKLSHHLLWYKDKRIPEYITKVGGVLTNTVMDTRELFEKAYQEGFAREM